MFIILGVTERFPVISRQIFSRWLGGGLLLMLLNLVAIAQETKPTADGVALLPAAPQGNVLDDAGLFREQPEKLAELQVALTGVESRRNYPVYLAIYYNVYDGDLQARADSLLAAWIGEDARGMVIVYQLDPVVSGNNPAIAFYKGSSLRSDLSGGPELQLISGTEVDSMLTRVFSKIKNEQEDHIPFITEVIRGVAAEIDQYHQVEPTRWSDSDNLNLMAVFLGIIVVLALLGVVLWKLFSKADARSNKVHYFPEVKVGRRLDAPFGGGLTSEKTFVPASARR